MARTLVRPRPTSVRGAAREPLCVGWERPDRDQRPCPATGCVRLVSSSRFPPRTERPYADGPSAHFRPRRRVVGHRPAPRPPPPPRPGGRGPLGRGGGGGGPR